MTSSSSPGFSLKQEGLSYMAGCELPAVIVNVQRGGPGLGNIAGSQGDYFQTVKGGGHGDYRMIVLAPTSAQEMYNFGFEAFDLADKYRNPVIILSDGIIGQMMEPVALDASRVPGTFAKDWKLDGAKGRAPRFIRSLLMGEGDLEQHNYDLKKKYDIIEANEVRCETKNIDDADVILVAFGVSARIARAAMRTARATGKKVGLIRPITLWPFPEKVIAAAAKTGSKFLVVEMNMGQMVEDVRRIACGATVEHIGRPGGGLTSEEEVVNAIESLMVKG
jgi:2-oxoglutarate ferredoxin oxidoreductase subunit alpha